MRTNDIFQGERFLADRGKLGVEGFQDFLDLTNVGPLLPGLDHAYVRSWWPQ